MGETLMVAGIGCRAGVSGEQVEAAINAAVAALRARQVDRELAETTMAAVPTLVSTLIQGAAELGAGSPVAPAMKTTRPAAAIESGRLTAIATPAAKAKEPGVQAAAAALGVPLIAIPQHALEAANPATVTRSARSMAAMNVHSVAEAAALAGALASGQGRQDRGPEVTATVANGRTPIEPDLAPGHRESKRTPRLLQPRIVAGPVTCALADTTTS